MIDHCTLWPDRIGPLDWSGCCLWHDIAYLYQLPRLESDLSFARCVWRVSPLMAIIMAIGVIAFGWVFYRSAGQASRLRSAIVKSGWI